jgi:UTP--glucose-1-phosphate uridylyltransferase
MTAAHPLKTVVFPVAGKGTRFRPATLATPKELLPLIAKPLLQFAIEEAVMAGAEKLVFVSSEAKPGIATYLSHPGVTADCEVVIVNQEKALGLGHAVLCARDHVKDDAFGVVLPDDLIFGPVGCLAQMTDARGSSGPNMIAVEPVAREHTNRYGIIDPSRHNGAMIRAKGIVEKPMPENAPSQLGVVGRYILDTGIFDRLANQPAGSGGEIQLTDALARDIERQGLNGYRFEGTRYDCGSPAGMLDATIAYARASGELCQSLERSLTLAA